MTLHLTDATHERARKLFQGEKLEFVVTKLERECGQNLPFCENATSESSERVRFAVLKLSEGCLEKFERALAVAKEDWRDVLVASGFGQDPTAHQRWYPNTH